MDLASFQHLLDDSAYHLDYPPPVHGFPDLSPHLEPLYPEPTYLNLTSPLEPQQPPPYYYGGPQQQPVQQPQCWLLKQEEYDEGFGSGHSSPKSLTPPVEEPWSPTGQTTESEVFLPPMPFFRKQCVKCGTSACPEHQWSVDTNTGHFLCHVCAIPTPPPQQQPQTETKKRHRHNAANSRRANIACMNCSTRVTSLWRRNVRGEFVCNACGLYEKLHKKQRPVTMRKDSIQKRKRRPRTDRRSNNQQIRRQSNVMDVQAFMNFA